jgi:hypothetical protein
MFFSISIAAILPSAVTIALLWSFDPSIALVAAPIVGSVAGLFGAMIAIIPGEGSGLNEQVRTAEASDWGLF